MGELIFPITGRCYCGAVHLEASTPPQSVAYCHCVDCRRVTGAPVAAFAAFSEGDVQISGAKLTSVSVSDGVERSFCGDCGSPVLGRYAYLPGQIYVSLGLLDQAGALAPETHCHVDEALGWLHIEDNAERIAGTARAVLQRGRG